MARSGSFDDNPSHPGRETTVARMAMTDKATGTVLAVFHRRQARFDPSKSWALQPGAAIPHDAIAVTDEATEVSKDFLDANPDLAIQVQLDSISLTEAGS